MPIGTTLALGLAGIGAAGGIGAAAIGSRAAGRAAGVQATASERAAELQYKAAQEALAFQRQMWQTQQRQFAPWLTAGRGALGNLSYLMGIPMPEAAQAAPAMAGAPSGGRMITLPSGRTVPLRELMLNRRFVDGGGFRGGAIPLSRLADGSFGVHPGGIPIEGVGGGGKFDPIMAGGGREGDIGLVDETGQPLLPPGVNPELGEFGSLMQPWEEEFLAPTITEDPGYQFRLQEGMRALEHSAAARGGLLTGQTAKAIADYSQGLASQEYGAAYNRALTEYQQAYNVFQQNQANMFNRLAAMSGMGQTAAGALTSAGGATAGRVGNILLGSAGDIGRAYQQAAAARASGYVGQGNVWGGALQGGLGNLQQLLMLRQLMQQPGAGA